MNEEEVKARIILPWLQERGLAPEELSLETSFSVRVGTNVLEIDGRPPKDRQRARLDILVRRRGLNLLVVETKELSSELSDEDRDQAISYARLVHPIAPFALVTNGKEFRLYDTFTKSAVPPDARLPDAGAIVLPDEARLEALKLFFAVSPENLTAFARSQVDRATEPLFGQPNDYSAVYIPQTHVERAELTAMAHSFLTGDRPVFVLGGESGMGKTCVMIDLSRTLGEKGYPVLFFRGALVQGNILDEIASEVEWAFGPQRGSIDTVRRLAENTGGKPLVIMIDAIEDWRLPEKVQHLVAVASHVGPLNVRLILSCKTGSWEPFTSAFGSRTGIERTIHNSSVERPFSAEVTPFSPKEFFTAVERHRNAFGIRGGFDPVAMREAQRSPFLLRLMFQVKAAEPLERERERSGEGGRITFDSGAFFEKYLHLAAVRTGQQEAATAALVAVARVLYDMDDEWVDEPALRAALDLRPMDHLPRSLFDQRLLIGSGAPGLRRIGFGFGLLRSYVIAFHVRQWPRTMAEDFAGEFAAAAFGTPRAEALRFYYPLATEDQKRAVDGPVRNNAEKYLHHYTSLIDEFPALRDSFSPYTTGRIGFVGELRFPPRIGMYGFRRIGDRDEEVLLIPVDTSDERSVRLFIAGVKAPHYFGFVDGFRAGVSPDRIRVTEVAEQIERMVEKGRLNETAAPLLAEELITCILRSQKVFSEFLHPTTRQLTYPIDTAAISKALTREFLTRHFRDEAVRAKREKGEIKEEWRGTVVSYNATLRRDEEQAVAARVETALTSGENVELRAHYTDLEPLKVRLGKALDARRGLGPHLVGPVLPLRDELISALQSGTVPSDALKTHCRRLLQLALAAYRRMIETNFPTLTQRFDFYQSLPVQIILAVDPNVQEDERQTTLVWCKSKSGSDEIVVLDPADVSIDLMNDTVTTPAGTQPFLSARWPDLREFLHGPFCHGLEFDCDSAVLRHWVYKWIQDDFRAVRDWLKRGDAAPPADVL